MFAVLARASVVVPASRCRQHRRTDCPREKRLDSQRTMYCSRCSPCSCRSNEQIAAANRRLAALARTDPEMVRLATAPSIGPITASAVVATVDAIGRLRRRTTSRRYGSKRAGGFCARKIRRRRRYARGGYGSRTAAGRGSPSSAPRVKCDVPVSFSDRSMAAARNETYRCGSKVCRPCTMAMTTIVASVAR